MFTVTFNFDYGSLWEVVAIPKCSNRYLTNALKAYPFSSLRQNEVLLTGGIMEIEFS